MKFLALIFALATAVLASETNEEVKIRAIQNPDLYDGDMAGIDGPFDLERSVISGQKYRWPAARVPFVIDASLSTQKQAIYNAFKNYHDNTCVRFVPRTNEKDYVRIFAGQGCYSNVGKIGNQQLLSLGDGCYDVGTIVHQLGHVLGFYHEHSRFDRDHYLIIYMENIQPGMEHNFIKLSLSQSTIKTPFSYSSIMIFDNYSFSKNGKPTMVAKNGKKMTHAYLKSGMTKTDIIRVKLTYDCL